MAALDRTGALRFLSASILAGGPLVALALNLLAIMHFSIDRGRRELHVAVKLRWANLVIVGVCLAILEALFLHILAETANHAGGAG